MQKSVSHFILDAKHKPLLFAYSLTPFPITHVYVIYWI